jgi:hypothetical protein
MAEAIKRLASKHGPPIKDHIKRNLHWHAVAVVGFVTAKEFAYSIAIEFVRSRL